MREEIIGGQRLILGDCLEVLPTLPAECFVVSLYSSKVDCRKLAEQHTWRGKKGGGHAGAAGFQCDKLPFKALK